MLQINFENTYSPIEIADDLSFMTFASPMRNNDEILIRVEIASLGEPLLPNVYNLSFGPLSNKNEIDDKAKVIHANTGKVFSTIILFSLVYLQANPTITIGVDGSNDARAYLYHRMFQTNKEYLSQYFVAVGVDWYVRLLRNGIIEEDKEGYPFFKPKPEPFDYLRTGTDLYRYYMFYLKSA